MGLAGRTCTVTSDHFKVSEYTLRDYAILPLTPSHRIYPQSML